MICDIEKRLRVFDFLVNISHTNVIDKEKMIDMVYKQYIAYKTKPTTIEDRLSALEEKVDKILEKIS